MASPQNQSDLKTRAQDISDKAVKHENNTQASSGMNLVTYPG